MNEELTRIEDAGPLTIDQLQGQVNLIQHVLKDIMKEKIHYGTIPGCGPKPTLLKPGAEKICMTFRLAPTYDLESIDLDMGHREVEVVCTLTHIPTGQVFGQGVGCCTTMEGKYRFRKAARKCPKCGVEALITDKFSKGEFKDGWLCWAKKDGCGRKFLKLDPEIINQDAGDIEHDNPADYFNTVLKMAKKRAMVDAVLTATAASDCFNQDIEDMPEVIPGAKKTKKEPEKKDAEPVDAEVVDPDESEKQWAEEEARQDDQSGGNATQGEKGTQASIPEDTPPKEKSDRIPKAKGNILYAKWKNIPDYTDEEKNGILKDMDLKSVYEARLEDFEKIKKHLDTFYKKGK